MSDVETAARKFIRKNPNSRAAKVLRAMLERGSVTTDELQKLGYNHPPRARMDVVDNGFSVKTTMIRDATGKRMASYSLVGDAELRDQVGRARIPKSFKNKLLAFYGEKDGITGWEVDGRALQVDHRIPYQVSGDSGLANQDVSVFMLLSGSSQRAKSFSCEQCRNFVELRDPAICATCYWAFPESYGHVAMRQVRRADIVWEDAEVAEFDALTEGAEAAGLTLADYVKRLLREGLDR
jgi:hypothetical protein